MKITYVLLTQKVFLSNFHSDNNNNHPHSQDNLEILVAKLLGTIRNSVEITTYSDLCSGLEIFLTLAAYDRADVMGNIAEITVVDTAQLSGTVTITEHQAGSYALDDSAQPAKTAGAAYVFHRVGGMWSQMAKLMSAVQTSGDEFGYSVDLAGDVAVVGAPGAEEEAGVAYIFKWDADRWNEVQILRPFPFISKKGDRFGHAVAISQTTIVIGAPGYLDNKGSVFVIEWSNGQFHTVNLLRVRVARVEC